MDGISLKPKTKPNIIPESTEYVFYNVKVGELNNKSYLNLKMSIIIHKVCDEYAKILKFFRTMNELHVEIYDGMEKDVRL